MFSLTSNIIEIVDLLGSVFAGLAIYAALLARTKEMLAFTAIVFVCALITSSWLVAAMITVGYTFLFIVYYFVNKIEAKNKVT